MFWNLRLLFTYISSFHSQKLIQSLPFSFCFCFGTVVCLRGQLYLWPLNQECCITGRWCNKCLIHSTLCLLCPVPCLWYYKEYIDSNTLGLSDDCTIWHYCMELVLFLFSLSGAVSVEYSRLQAYGLTRLHPRALQYVVWALATRFHVLIVSFTAPLDIVRHQSNVRCVLLTLCLVSVDLPMTGTGIR